jgi:hypothetical protein
MSNLAPPTPWDSYKGLKVGVFRQVISPELNGEQPSGTARLEDPPPGGVTWRAALISLLVIAATAPAIFYGEVVWFRETPQFWVGGWSSGVPAPWPLTVLFLLTVVLSIPALRRLRLTRQELLTVYSTVLVATPVFGMHVLLYLLGKVPSYRYYGLTQPLWDAQFLRLIPRWWGPASDASAVGFYMGGASVPWSEWALPLAAWSSVILSLYLANVCLLVLVQKQWIRNERLSFPLAQIPLEAVSEISDRDRTARPPVNRAFWVGLIVAAVVGFLSQLSQRLPAVPSLPMEVTLMSAQYVGPLAALGDVQLWLYPWLIALAYLVPQELSFSVWFLWLARIGLCAVAIMYGHAPMASEWWYEFSFPAPLSQATGAVVALSLWALWTARRHLGRAVRIAFSPGLAGGDSDEPLPYRWALIGFLISVSWLVTFLILAGNRPLFGLIYVTILVGLYLAYARVQAEGAFDPFFWWGNSMGIVLMGMGNLRPTEILTLYEMNWAGSPLPSRIFSVCSINTLTSFKIADASGTRKRSLVYLLFAALAVALAVGIYVTLTVLYHRGFLATGLAKGKYFVPWALQAEGGQISYYIAAGGDRDVSGVLGIAGGAMVAIFFGIMRLRFLWWPLNPIGYVLSNSIPQAMGTFPFFIAWALKTLVTRYGGLRLYRQTIPLAIGLIVGDVLNSSLWNIIRLASKGRF